MANRILWGLLIALIAAILGVVSLKFRPLALPDAARLAVPDPDCDLRAGPCTGRFAGGGEVTLDMEPRGLPLARPLELRVTTRGVAADAVALDLVGVDMDMGYNRPSLVPAGAGLYRGQGMLPVCVRRRMTWEARVLLSTPDGLLVAPFRFATSR
ncbi:hypothetical protein [uncultured Thiodictyon sp.]|uniref:hypothetical protein n=1 Tax=uncultured Thiodictyon sp. TaxID=1846217 RepID=UPI0025FDDB80|nr:hypothetical protein [uncultured Thiodictyon sp.]